MIKAPKIAVLRTDNASTLSYGEIWHYFEQQLKYPLMQVDEGRLEMSLAEIDQLLLPNGYYSKWNDSELNDKLMEWVRPSPSQGPQVPSVRDHRYTRTCMRHLYRA